MATTYVTGTLVTLEAERAKLRTEEQLPRRSIVVGGPDMLPKVHAPGAPGWTEEILAAPLDAKDGTGVLEVPSEYAGRVTGTKLTAAALPKKYADLVSAKTTVVVADAEVVAK